MKSFLEVVGLIVLVPFCVLAIWLFIVVLFSI